MTEEIYTIQGDAELREARRLKEGKEREEWLAAFRKVLAAKEGRAFVWRLLSWTGVYRSTFSNQPLDMAYAEGIRSVGLKLLADVQEASVEMYDLMTRENRNRE